jgi:hypothetical protein
MAKAAQTSSQLDGPGSSRARRLLGRGMGVVLVSLLSLAASAHAVLPELQVPSEVARMAASVVPAGVLPTSTPAMAAPTSATSPTPILNQAEATNVAAATGAAPQPAVVARSSSPPPASAIGRSAAIVAESPEGTSPGTGGALARTERVTRSAASLVDRASLRAHHRDAAPTRGGGFALRPGARTAPTLELSQTASSPASLVTALGPLAASAPLTGTDTLVTLMVLFGGALLIALMCADALGVGPRHDYLRRQISHHRWPWR